MRVKWDKKQRESAFCEEANLPATWVVRSRFLKESAEKIYVVNDANSSHLVWIYYMLLGMALESLIKGHMVARGIQVIEKKR